MAILRISSPTPTASNAFQPLFDSARLIDLPAETPFIILGDFNSDWFSDESVVKELAEKSQLKVYEPRAENLHTYVKRGRRLDWILISNELEFVSYKVLPDVISDHLAVVAEVKVSKQ